VTARRAVTEFGTLSGIVATGMAALASLAARAAAPPGLPATAAAAGLAAPAKLGA
jgi:hypothetical protein